MRNQLLGLTYSWIAVTFIAEILPPTAAAILGIIMTIVTLAVVGATLLVPILGGDTEDHLFAGLMLALPGCLLTHFLFHWHLSNPAHACGSIAVAGCESGSALTVMFVNFIIIAIGTVLVAIPAVPVMMKLRKGR